MSKLKRQPTELSKQEWKKALLATKDALQSKDLSMLAAGVSYFSTLAFFPAMTAFVSIYALFVTHQQVLAFGAAVKQFMPSALAEVITQQLLTLSGHPRTSLIAAIVAILLALFGASSAVQNLIRALNRAYGVEDRRKGIKLRLISLAFMAGFIVVAFPLLGLLVMQPSFLTHLGVPHTLAVALSIARWVLLIGLVTLVLAVVYRYAPDRREPRWGIVSWGGAAATLIWALGTALFFVYVQYLASFSKTYGVFAGIIILMSWLNLSALIVLLGAEVNHHLEEETEPMQKLSRWSPRRLFSRSSR